MYERIVCNLSVTNIKHVTLQGRDHLEVPAVMITEGVHVGTDGPGYYPKDELERTPTLWNHKPAVLEHPQENGIGITASDPIIMNTQQIGLLMKTGWKDPKLSTKAYLDVELLTNKAPQVLAALLKGEKVEVSTGMQVDKDRTTPGEWNGEKYDWIARNIRPDHLAILMSGPGACSIADGGGLLANKATCKCGKADCAVCKAAKDKAKETTVTGNALTHGETRSALNGALAERHSGDSTDYWGGYIEDVFPDKVVYSRRSAGKEQMYAHDYSIGNDGKVELGNAPTPVKRVTEYRKVDDGSVVGNVSSLVGNASSLLYLTEAPTRNAAMDKAALINGMIGKGFEETDRVWLEAQDVTILNKLHPKFVSPVAVQKTDAGGIAAIVGNTAPVQLTMEQARQILPPEMLAVLDRGEQSINQERDGFIAAITANKANTFTTEWLKSQTPEVLQGLASIANNSAPPRANYSGAATVPSTQLTNNKQPKSLGLPSMASATK